ncbi:MAG TPA: NAD kinase [Rhodocyclaceae bacterium]|nr:NAD kinase [Rhodocyclaceae bacterium]
MTTPFTKPIRTAAVIGKYHSPEVAAALPLLADLLRARGVRLLVEEELARQIGTAGAAAASYETMGGEADVAIVMGGDGTMLYAARQLAAFGVPLAGVNQGRLGFMTDIAHNEMLTGIGDLLAGRFAADRRVLLEGEIWRDGVRLCGSPAFNEVVVNKGDLGRMIEMKVEVDGEFLYLLRADGLIVATPTGSTAYSLSANGPILHPMVAGIGLVPLCPHALSNRPITISDDCTVEVTLISTHDARVHFDAVERYDVRAGDRLRVVRSPLTVTLLHPPGYSYYAMLRGKLHWSEAPKH